VSGGDPWITESRADMEVAMIASEQVQIEVEAAKALARWKALFADEVCERARRLAARSDPPNWVTLAHYRQAAESALQSLSNAIQREEGPDGRHEAA
jgi:hypothetical protein